GALLRVRRVERREPAQVRDVVRARNRRALRAEQGVEPPVAKPRVGARRRLGRRDERALELAQRDPLLLLVARDRVRLARQLGLELFGRPQEVEPVGIELGRAVGLERAELLALAVVVEDREPSLGRAQRELLAAIGHPGGEDRVLDRVVPLGELGEEEAGLAGLAEPVEPLALVAPRALPGVAAPRG